MKFFTVFAAIVAVAVARHTTTSWTLAELSDALQNPNTDPALVPVLEQALNELMAALFAGQDLESIQVPLPTPVITSPVAVEPTPVVTAPAASANSPLVQIIINVKGQEQVADIAAPVSPAPVVVPEIETVVPTPVQVVDTPAVIPTPVQVVETPIVEPTPVVVVPGAPEANPVDVIAVNPVIVAPEVSPIDMIAVNPVDSWGPEGFMPAIDSEDVGPM